MQINAARCPCRDIKTTLNWNSLEDWLYYHQLACPSKYSCGISVQHNCVLIVIQVLGTGKKWCNYKKHILFLPSFWIGHKIPDKNPWKKITNINVLRVENNKYETTSRIVPDMLGLDWRLIHPDIYTPNPVWIIGKNLFSQYLPLMLAILQNV